MAKLEDETRADVLRLVKEAHAAGRELTRDEVVEVITRPIYMGRPQVPRSPVGKRGPKPGKDQYRLAFERRRDLYRRLVTLPELGRASGWLARHEYVCLLVEVALNERIASRRKVAAVSHRLALAAQPAPDMRTVRRHLAAIGRIVGKK